MQSKGQIMLDGLLNALVLVMIISTAFYFMFFMNEKLAKNSLELEKKALAINIVNFLTEKKLVTGDALDLEKIRVASDLGILDLKREMNIANETISIKIWGENKKYETREKCGGWCVNRGITVDNEFGFIEVCVC